MIRYLTFAEVLTLHADLLAASGGAAGIRDIGRTHAALAQPMATFDGVELYPTLVAKAAALGFLLIQGHPFVDGNKRVGHAAVEVFLMLNRFEVCASVDEQEAIILDVAAGALSHEAFTEWLHKHVQPLDEDE